MPSGSIRTRALDGCNGFLPGRGGHAHADPPAPVAQLRRLRVASAPAEPFGAGAHAGDQIAAGIGDVLGRVLRRLVAYAQLDRVDPERLGQFVHGAFQRQHADRLARRAHGGRNRDVQRHQPVTGLPVGAGIHRPGLVRGTLVILFRGQVAGQHVMPDRLDMPFGVGADADPLHRVGTVGGNVEDLLPGEGDLHRPAGLTRADRGQDGVCIHPQLGAEAAADIAADDADISERQPEGPGDRLLRLVEHLVGGEDREPVALPHRDGGMRLHHRVALQRRGVGHVEPYRGGAEGADEIAICGVGRALRLLGHFREAGIGGQRVFPGLPVVLHAHPVGRRARLLEGLGDHQRDRLAVMPHFRAGKHGAGLAMVAAALWRRVPPGQHLDHAGQGFGGGGVDGGDPAAADRGRHDETIGGRAGLADLVGVARRPGDLQRTVDPVQRPADKARLRGVEQVRPDGRVHLDHADVLSSGWFRREPRAGCAGPEAA